MSPVEEGEGWHGAESYDCKKAWSSINGSVFSGVIEVGGAVEIAGQSLQRDSSSRSKSFAMSRFDLCNVGTCYSIKNYTIFYYVDVPAEYYEYYDIDDERKLEILQDLKTKLCVLLMYCKV